MAESVSTVPFISFIFKACSDVLYPLLSVEKGTQIDCFGCFFRHRKSALKEFVLVVFQNLTPETGKVPFSGGVVFRVFSVFFGSFFENRYEIMD